MVIIGFLMRFGPTLGHEALDLALGHEAQENLQTLVHLSSMDFVLKEASLSIRKGLNLNQTNLELEHEKASI